MQNCPSGASRFPFSPTVDDAAVAVNGSKIFGPTTLEHGAALHLGEYRLAIVDPKRERPVAAVVGGAPGFSWALQSKSTALANKLFLIESDMIVGRARECDLSLAVAHLSRRHARLFFEDGGLWVEDLGSANGTFLNGRRVERSRVRSGDELAFDTLVFTVRGEAAEDASAEHDKTSLRRAIVAPAAEAQAPRQNGAVNRSPSAKSPDLRKPVTADTPAPPAESSGWLWWGIAAAVLLTVVAVVYFTT